MRSVGLHIRITNSIHDLAQKALRLDIPFFQCFFLETMAGKVINPTRQEIDYFLDVYRSRFSSLYLHGSYWINLAGIENTGHHALYRELVLAQKLAFTHLVLHPGSAHGAHTKQEGIEALARSLNILNKKNTGIKIVLENIAHGGMSVGGDFDDFRKLLALIDHPEKLLFCLDTAHAFSYGYDIATVQGQESFITTVDSNVGIDKIALIHLNDSQEKLGSRLDKHASFGQGSIGYAALKAFALHEKLATIPLLLELPITDENQERTLLDDIRSWN